jgi:hypothetical protein
MFNYDWYCLNLIEGVVMSIKKGDKIYNNRFDDLKHGKFKNMFILLKW